MRILGTYWICIAFWPVGLAVADDRPATETVALRGRTMGTTYNVKFTAAPGDGQALNVQGAVDEILARFDLLMSTYRPDSELSRFTAAEAGQWFPVSAETAFAVAHALNVHRRTGGASDVTIGPVLRLWQFGGTSKRAQEPGRAPTQAELLAAMAKVGAGQLQVRTSPPALRKERPGLEVDLSSMAPGYAVDLIVEMLTSRGVANAIVEIGGEVRAIGVRVDGRPWRVGVESPPGEAHAQIAEVVSLRNMALATSGDYRDVREVGKRRYSHVIDPRTGHALPARGACVTVLAETCLEADSLGAPLMVMGIEAGFEWCEKHGVAAMFQLRDQQTGELVRRSTPRFETLVGGD